MLASSLAWVEITRAIRSRQRADALNNVNDSIEAALSGIAERPIMADVASLSRRIEPARLRTLDAIHLATAVLLDTDVMVTYDDRLAAAARFNGVTVATPDQARDA